jgi:hypothetical protein
MSKLTLLNRTSFAAQYVVLKGEQLIARIPEIAPDAKLSIPSDVTYAVIATADIAGNTHTSAPHIVRQNTGFLAQVLQVACQGSYQFDVQEIANTTPNTLTFQKTCQSPVTFTITKDGVPLQNIVVNDNFQNRALEMGDTFHVYAVINGVTTATTTFTDPSATITAISDTSAPESGGMTLQVT